MLGGDKPRPVKDRSVFGRGRGLAKNPEVGSGVAALGGVPIGTFRRTLKEREAPPPREIVTGKLMGDPEPGRVVPEIPEAPGSGCVQPPAPIYLTFREYEAAKARGEIRCAARE